MSYTARLYKAGGKEIITVKVLKKEAMQRDELWWVLLDSKDIV